MSKKVIKRNLKHKKPKDFYTLKLILSLKKHLRRKHPDNVLESIVFELEEFLDRYGLTSAKNGKGGIAYDGWGYDPQSKTLEFFWFLETNPAGKAQYSKLSRKLGLVAPLIRAYYNR